MLLLVGVGDTAQRPGAQFLKAPCNSWIGLCSRILAIFVLPLQAKTGQAGSWSYQLLRPLPSSLGRHLAGGLLSQPRDTSVARVNPRNAQNLL